jgi:hypothetical protein
VASPDQPLCSTEENAQLGRMESLRRLSHCNRSW